MHFCGVSPLVTFLVSPFYRYKPSTKSPKLKENMTGPKILFMKQEVKTLDHGNLEMMKVVKEYERAISEVIADRERERVCHVSFRQSFTRICLKFEIKTNIMVRLMLPYMYFLISKA